MAICFFCLVLFLILNQISRAAMIRRNMRAKQAPITGRSIWRLICFLSQFSVGGGYVWEVGVWEVGVGGDWLMTKSVEGLGADTLLLRIWSDWNKSPLELFVVCLFVPIIAILSLEEEFG